MKIVFYLLTGLMIFSRSIFGQATVNGFFEYDNMTYFKSMDNKINGRNQAILQLEVNHELNSLANVFGSVEIREDQANPSRNRAYLDEAYLNLYLGDFDIRLGKQIYSWGKADGYNPTDNLTSWDFTDVLDTKDEKIGSISAKVIYYHDDWSFEGVILPAYVPSLLPGTSSRWFPSFSPRINNPYFPVSGKQYLNTNYNFVNNKLPDVTLKNLQYAFRISGNLKGWDVSLSWFDGYDDLPYLSSSVNIDSTFSNAEITLRKNYYKRKSLGAAFSTVIDKVGFRGEAAYYITSDWEGTNPKVDNPYLQYVIGFDYTIDKIIAENNLFIILQWIQEFQIPDYNLRYSVTDLNHVFRKSIMGKMDLDLGSFAKLKIQGVYNIGSGDWWLQPGIDWSVTDGVNLTLLTDLLSGPEDSFFGLFKNNKRIQLKVKYNF